jgi:hypothetical protein
VNDLFSAEKSSPPPRDADEKTLRLCFNEADAIKASIALCGLTYREIALRYGKGKTLIGLLAKGERGVSGTKRTDAFCHATGTNLLKQYRAMDRAFREAMGKMRERDRVEAIVAPTRRVWESA